MMCECVAKVNEQLTEKNLTLREVSLINMTMGKVRQSLVLPVERLRSDEPRSKTKHIIPSYCPFCGERYQREAADTTDSGCVS
jgi:hypothetical protein